MVMSVSLGARHIARFLTNLVAIAAVSAIFAAKAMDAGMYADDTDAALIATAPSN